MIYTTTGMRCPDPGRPADGQQVNSSSYDQGDLVHFQCDREGFTLSDPNPLLCRLNNAGNALEWNGTVPTCVGKLDRFVQVPTLLVDSFCADVHDAFSFRVGVRAAVNF